MTLAELQKIIFSPSATPLAPGDFFLLLVHATGKEKVFLLAHPEYELTEEEETTIQSLVERRRKYEPIAYLTHHKEFYGRDFLVTQDTLIPRPETEVLIEEIIREATEKQESVDILDIGTGSGNIIITLAHELPQENFHFYGIDISLSALAIAQKNAKKHHINTRIIFLHSDLLEKCLFLSERKKKKERHAIIAANLPYLSHEIYSTSKRDVRDYEPRNALISGESGLDHYLRLLEELPLFSSAYRSMTLFLEISPEQSKSIVGKIIEIFPTASTQIFQDLSGKGRLIKASF